MERRAVEALAGRRAELERLSTAFGDATSDLLLRFRSSDGNELVLIPDVPRGLRESVLRGDLIPFITVKVARGIRPLTVSP